MNEYLSGDKLYRYLHISKRKMKYLLDNEYIPVIHTGMKTHRFIIRFQDAEDFKQRMETEPGFLAELKGIFSSQYPRERTLPILEPTEENCKAFALYLHKKFADVPEALTAAQAADLVGRKPQHISNLCARKVLWSILIGGKRYCTKDSLIQHLSSADMVINPNQTKEYKSIVADFIQASK